MRSPLSFLVAVALAASGVAQSEIRLHPCAQGIGKPVQYEIGPGKAFQPFLFLSSLQRASIPLAGIDPRDPRSLGVGFDLLGLLLIGRLDAQGEARFGFLMPNDPALAGKALLHQVLTFPGSTLLFGPMSQVGVIPLEPAGSWRTYPQEVMNNERAWNSSLPLRDGRVLFCGGGTGAMLALTAWRTTSVYDPATRRFSNGPDMTQERGVHTVSPLPDGRHLLVGGVDMKNDPQVTCDYYDPVADRFTAAPLMAEPRMAHTATVLGDGRIFVTGGLSDLNGQLQAIGSALATTEVFDPKTSQWSKGPNLTEPKAGHTALLLADGRVAILGGITWRSILGLKIPSFSARLEIFDPKTNQIVLRASMATARAGHGSTVLPSGKLLIAGGVGGTPLTGGTPVSSCEIYDLGTDQWATTAPLRSAKGLMGMVWLADGRWAVIGGAQGSLLAPVGVAECEAFDPVTSTWNPLPSLASARATHVALLLDGCAVLVVGGDAGGSIGALKTQELLFP